MPISLHYRKTEVDLGKKSLTKCFNRWWKFNPFPNNGERNRRCSLNRDQV